MHYKVLRAPSGHRALKYRTRRLLPGEIFEADDARSDDAALLNIYKTKRYIAPHREPGKVEAPPADLADRLVPTSDDEMKSLRAEYRAKFGKGPGPTWDAATLREKIGEAE